MKLRIFAASLTVLVCAPKLPAVDSQLLNLVMPDAKLLAGVNVDQAKGSALGQFVLAEFQAHDQHFREITEQTGFDPTRDLHEVLLASNGAQSHATGLALARGTFDISRINTAAQSGGAHAEIYKGVTILEDPKGQHGYAFLNPTLAVAGDLASLKGAIDRQTVPAPLPAALIVKVNRLSTTEDAWGISEVPPPVQGIPTPNGAPISPTVFQNIKEASGGVKFGDDVVATSELQADTAANATALANVLQFLVNLAQLQAQKDPQAAALLKPLMVKTTGDRVEISWSIPEAEAEKIIQTKTKAQAPVPPAARRREGRL